MTLPPLAYPLDAEPAPLRVVGRLDPPAFVTPALERPCRSLSEVAREWRGERIMLLLAQMEAETCGDDAAAADCLRRIATLDKRLQKLDAAITPL